MKLSKKKETKLYEVVHEEIMQARLKIWKMRFDNDLCMSSCGLNRRNLIRSRKDEYTRNFI